MKSWRTTFYEKEKKNPKHVYAPFNVSCKVGNSEICGGVILQVRTLIY